MKPTSSVSPVNRNHYTSVKEKKDGEHAQLYSKHRNKKIQDSSDVQSEVQRVINRSYSQKNRVFELDPTHFRKISKEEHKDEKHLFKPEGLIDPESPQRKKLEQ